MKKLPVFPGRRSCPASSVLLPLNQNIQGKMLHVVKIYDVLPALFLIQHPFKLQNQAHQRIYRKKRRFHTADGLLGTDGKKAFPDLLNLLFGLAAQPLRPLPGISAHAPVLFARQTSEADFPASLAQRRKGFRPCSILRHFPLLLQQFAVKIRAVRALRCL